MVTRSIDQFDFATPSLLPSCSAQGRARPLFVRGNGATATTAETTAAAARVLVVDVYVTYVTALICTFIFYLI